MGWTNSGRGMTFGWGLALQEVAGCTLHECKLPRRQRRLVRTARQRAFGPALVINLADASCIGPVPKDRARQWPRIDRRSEEHTSELQSPCNLVCRLLLEKKKKD